MVGLVLVTFLKKNAVSVSYTTQLKSRMATYANIMEYRPKLITHTIYSTEPCNERQY